MEKKEKELYATLLNKYLLNWQMADFAFMLSNSIRIIHLTPVTKLFLRLLVLVITMVVLTGISGEFHA